MEATFKPVKRKWHSLSLFWKVWVACVLSVMMSVFSLVAVTLVTRTNAIIQTWTELSGNALHYAGRYAASAYESQGEAALHSALSEASERARLNLWFFDGERRLLFGTEPDARVRDLAEQGRTFGSSARLLSMDGARRVTGESRRSYVIVGVAQDAFASRPVAFFLRGFFFFGFPALFAFLLARHVSHPILSLRNAVNQVAEGDVAIKVGESVGKRNDEIEDLAHDFDKMTERISALLLAQKRLLGDISHELRSPLARLAVALAIAQERAGAEAQAPLSRIEKEAGRMNEMIGSLLTLARLEADSGAVIEVAPIDLEALVREVANDADFEAKGRGRGVALMESAPCLLNGNREALSSAIENILRNAVKYTHEGTTVEARLAVVEREGRRYALFQTLDKGDGVPEEDLERLFLPFYRVSEDRSRQSGGAGLGLAITQRAAAFHGGSVRAENAPQGGLLVALEIPLEQAAVI